MSDIPQPRPLGAKVYIGDGLYAEFDGYHVILRTTSLPPASVDHFVALEPEVITGFVRFVAGLRAKSPGQEVPVWEALKAAVAEATCVEGENAIAFVMRTTIDTLTGRPFRWNSVCVHIADDGKRTIVPQRMTSRNAIWLHPSRVPLKLLTELNQESVWGADDALMPR